MTIINLAMLQNIGILATIYLIIPTLAQNRTFMVANQRPRMMQNYVYPRALKNNVDGDKVGVLHATEPFQPNIYPVKYTELHALRNYIFLHDNTIETRTPKTGNIKVKKYDPNNEYGHKDVPCTCEQEKRDVKILSDDYFPPVLETRICDARLCPTSYGCKERLHYVTVLKRKRYLEEISELQMPEDLEKRWIAVREPVVVACMCLKQNSNFD